MTTNDLVTRNAEKIMKVSRKTKKALKKAVLKPIDPDWKSKDVRIQRLTKNYKYASESPTVGRLSVTAYSLGVRY